MYILLCKLRGGILVPDTIYKMNGFKTFDCTNFVMISVNLSDIEEIANLFLISANLTKFAIFTAYLER